MAGAPHRLAKSYGAESQCNINGGTDHMTDDIILRNAVPGDAPRLLEIYAYYITNTAVTYEDTVPKLQDFRKHMEDIMSRYPFFVIEENGTVYGYTYAAPFYEHRAFSHCCQLSIYLDHGHLKRGYGRMLLEALEAALQKQGITNLYACIGDPVLEHDEYLTRNSEEFHRHLGYSKIGTFHSFGKKFNHEYNMVRMEKLLGKESSAD